MFRFSSRVNISQPNPIAVESARLKAAGIKVGQLNDSNPTRHKLAPSCLDSVYLADPKGPLLRGSCFPNILRGGILRGGIMREEKVCAKTLIIRQTPIICIF